jgi:translation initiation factor 5A
MSDDEFVSGDAGAAGTTPIRVGELKKGGLVMIKGHPCKVREMTACAPPNRPRSALDSARRRARAAAFARAKVDGGLLRTKRAAAGAFWAVSWRRRSLRAGAGRRARDSTGADPLTNFVLPASFKARALAHARAARYSSERTRTFVHVPARRAAARGGPELCSQSLAEILTPAFPSPSTPSPPQIVDYSTAKTGKHGSAKAMYVGIDIFTGNKYEDTAPTGANTAMPVMVRSEWLLTDINDDDANDEGSIASLLNPETGDTRDDLRVPDDKEYANLREALAADIKDIIVTVTEAIGKAKIQSEFVQKDRK